MPSSSVPCTTALKLRFYGLCGPRRSGSLAMSLLLVKSLKEHSSQIPRASRFGWPPSRSKRRTANLVSRGSFSSVHGLLPIHNEYVLFYRHSAMHPDTPWRRSG